MLDFIFLIPMVVLGLIFLLGVIGASASGTSVRANWFWFIISIVLIVTPLILNP